MWKKIWNPSNRKVLFLNIAAALVLNFFLEYMERKSLSDLFLFMGDRTFIFLYNMLIIFISLSLVFLVKKKYFAYGIICAGWGIIGLVNGVILNSRNTPFTAVDMTIFKSTIPVLTSYLNVLQIAGLVVLFILAIAGLVVLFLYCPVAKKEFDMRANAIIVFCMLLLFGISTYFGVGRGLLISKFDNLIAGYQDYGVAYGFCITAIDTGIDRPIDYSRTRVQKLMKSMDKKSKKMEKEKNEVADCQPNIIFIQLESFFDITDVEGVTVSQDPLPNLHRLQEETTSGYVRVPVYGAGTINTEFEMITGMNLSYFGTGEYPYRSILHKTTCDSMAYWMKKSGYTSTVIHNNNASFYDRDYVFSNLGFDYFITSENMDIRKYTTEGWAKDSILEKYILDTLEHTNTRDYIYTISVQGHGDYPSDALSDPDILVQGEGWSEKYTNMVTYYVNQTAEMDNFIGNLLESLAEYPEETIVVAYGDHLPGLDFESEQLKSGSKYKTPYFIWDNFGFNEAHKEELSENVKAYQMASKVLSEIGDYDGVMNRFHQTMKQSDRYQKNMKLLQYDLLYGSDFALADSGKPVATDLKLALDDVRIRKVTCSEESAYIIGKNFTNYSRVYVNGLPVSTAKISNFALKIPLSSIKDGDEIIVHQVSKTNENITLNESAPFTLYKENMESVLAQ